MLAALLVCPQGWPPCMQQKPGIYCPKQIAYSIIVCLVNTEVSETALCGTNKSTVSNYELAIILVPHFKLQEPPINLQHSHVPWICKLFSSKRNMRLHGVLSTMYSINRFSIILDVVVIAQSEHTTLEGPFKPVTRSFDKSLLWGSDDLPMDHPRLKRNVTSMFPEQIAIAISSSSSMWVSWVTGDAQVGLNVIPLDPSIVASEVWYGKESRKYPMKRRGVSMVYSQLYAFEGFWNYTSGIIHHMRIDGNEVTLLFFYCYHFDA